MTTITVDRPRLVRRARILNVFTIGWNTLEGIIAVGAGIAAGSVSLISFGLDSGIEVSAALILAWRLSHERHDECQQPADRRAQRGIAISFLALAGYVFVTSMIDLRTGHRPGESIPGIVIAALSLIVMPVIAAQKRSLAADLGSRAASAEANQTDLCAMLSAALLIGLGANALFGWWWADSVAALIIGTTAGWMAIKTWRADSLTDTCCA